MVTIITCETSLFGHGKAERKYVVHKELLCYHSLFFDKAFNGPFTEGVTQTMQLNDVESDIFGLVVFWVYHQKLGGARRYRGSNPVVELTVQMNHLAQLWILGDRFLMPGLQNAAIDAIFYEDINYVSESTVIEASKLAYSGEFKELRKLMVSKLALEVNWSAGFIADFEGIIDKVPSSMAVDIAKFQRELHRLLRADLRAEIGHRKTFHLGVDGDVLKGKK